MGWSVGDGRRTNQEGNLVLIPFIVTVTTSDLPSGYEPDVDATNDTLEASRAGGRIGLVKGWRVAQGTGILSLNPLTPLAPGSVLAVDWSIARDSDVVIRFTVSIEISPLVAINGNVAASPNYLNGLAADWIRLKFKDSAGNVKYIPPYPGTVQAFASGELDFDASLAGKLPSADDGSAAHLVLSVDAHGEWIQPTAGEKLNMTPWHDLTGAHNLAGVGGLNRDLTGGAVPPRVNFSNDDPPVNPARFTADTTPPVVTSNATIAVVFRPEENADEATIVGRWNADGDPSWRIFLGAGDDAGKIIYQTIDYPNVINQRFDIGEDDSVLLFAIRRNDSATGNTQAWINGRPYDLRTSTRYVDTGTGPFSMGARKRADGAWIEEFFGDMRQAALYDVEIDAYQMSLLLYIMAQRAVVPLGTPIPAEWQRQPFDAESNESLPPERRLDRRPIAVVNLYSGKYTGNLFGQRTSWRPSSGDKEDIKSFIRPIIRQALVGCDQFEIMFNRPAGRFANDVPISLVTAVVPQEPNDLPAIAAFQADAMVDIWDEFGLSDHNDDALGLRRGWFYTGSGLPLDDNGQINPTGFLDNRLVGPLDGPTYVDGVLGVWKSWWDARFCCLFLDASVHFYGKFVEAAHHEAVYGAFTVVGEGIPQSGFEDGAPTVPLEYAARKGAPWFAQARNGSAPWWNLDDAHRTNKKFGYNSSWTAGDWNYTPIYFGVLDNEYLNLHIFSREQGDTEWSNLSLGDIYQWVRKGATPVVFYAQFAKIGAAWDYGTNRIGVSRYANSPRICRVARS